MTNDAGVVRNLGGHGRGLAGTVRTSAEGPGGQDPVEGLSDTQSDTEQMDIFNGFETTAASGARRRGMNAWARQDSSLSVCDLPCGC